MSPSNRTAGHTGDFAGFYQACTQESNTAMERVHIYSGFSYQNLHSVRGFSTAMFDCQRLHLPFLWTPAMAIDWNSSPFISRWYKPRMAIISGRWRTILPQWRHGVVAHCQTSCWQFTGSAIAFAPCDHCHQFRPSHLSGQMCPESGRHPCSSVSIHYQPSSSWGSCYGIQLLGIHLWTLYANYLGKS